MRYLVYLLLSVLLTNQSAYAGEKLDSLKLQNIIKKDSVLITAIDQSTALKINQVSKAEKTFDKKNTNSILLSLKEKEWIAAHPVLRIHNEMDWAPYNFNKKGKPKGYSIDYIKLVCEKLGFKIKFINGPSWNEFLKMMKDGKLDVMLNIAKSPQREKFLFFIPSYIEMIQMIYSRYDFPIINSIEDLFNKKFAVPKGFYMIEELKKYPQINIVEVKNISEAIYAVSTAKADVLFGLMPVVNYITNQLQITNIKVGGDIGITNSKPIPLHIAVSRNNIKLGALLEKGMLMLHDDEITNLQIKWLTCRLPEDDYAMTTVSKRPNTRILSKKKINLEKFLFKLSSMMMALVLIILIVLFFFNRFTKKKNITINRIVRLKRFGLLLLIVSLGLIIMTTWISMGQLKAQIKNEFGKSLNTVLTTTHEALSIWVDNNLAFVENIANTKLVQQETEKLLTLTPTKDVLQNSESLKVLRNYIKSMQNRIRYMGFSIISFDSINYGSKYNMNLGVKNMIAEKYPALLQSVFRGKTLLIPPIKSSVIVPNKNTISSEHLPAIFFATPIKNSKGSVIAVMTIRVDISHDFNRIISLGRIGVSGETYAFDLSARLISEIRFEEMLQNIGLIKNKQTTTFNISLRDPGGNLLQGFKLPSDFKKLSLTQMAEKAIAGQSGMNLKGYRDYRGVEVLGVWLWDSILNIGLATEIDLKEAMQSYNFIQNTIVILLIITVFLAIILIVFAIWIGQQANLSLLKSQNELEEKVKQRTFELKESEKRSNTILNSINAGIMIIEFENQKINYINPIAAKMIGLHPKKIIGKMSHEFTHQQKHTNYFAINSINDNDKINDMEHILLTDDGNQIPIIKTVVPIRLKGKKYLLETFLDLTARKTIEVKLQSTIEELRRFNLLTINREKTMVKLKEEVNELLKKMGEKAKYTIVTV